MPYVQPQAVGYIDPQALAAATAGIHASGATVQFELRMDWYAGADEGTLWPTTDIIAP